MRGCYAVALGMVVDVGVGVVGLGPLAEGVGGDGESPAGVVELGDQRIPLLRGRGLGLEHGGGLIEPATQLGSKLCDALFGDELGGGPLAVLRRLWENQLAGALCSLEPAAAARVSFQRMRLCWRTCSKQGIRLRQQQPGRNRIS